MIEIHACMLAPARAAVLAERVARLVVPVFREVMGPDAEDLGECLDQANDPAVWPTAEAGASRARSAARIRADMVAGTDLDLAYRCMRAASAAESVLEALDIIRNPGLNRRYLVSVIARAVDAGIPATVIRAELDKP